MDEDKAFEELNRKEAEKIDFGAEAEAFILDAKQRHILVTFNNTPIKVRPALPRDVSLKIGKMEARLSQVAKKLKGIEEDEISEDFIDELFGFDETDTTAEILSMLCLSNPFNQKQFWLRFERDTKLLNAMYVKLLDEISASEKKITEFRKD